jgi:hypothetical protein
MAESIESKHRKVGNYVWFPSSATNPELARGGEYKVTLDGYFSEAELEEILEAVKLEKSLIRPEEVANEKN